MNVHRGQMHRVLLNVQAVKIVLPSAMSAGRPVILREMEPATGSRTRRRVRRATRAVLTHRATRMHRVLRAKAANGVKPSATTSILRVHPVRARAFPPMPRQHLKSTASVRRVALPDLSRPVKFVAVRPMRTTAVA